MGRDYLRLNRFALNLVLDHTREQPRALAMANNPTALVLVLQVVVPRVDYIVVVRARIPSLHRFARVPCAKGGQRERAIEWRELPAHSAVPPELRRCHPDFAAGFMSLYGVVSSEAVG